jgi:hypothetical protein
MRVVPCFVVLAAVTAGCGEDLGTCDMNAATQVVYAADGTPYYAGQGLVQSSCADGVCHSSAAVNDSRKGAPHGLNFDLHPLTAQSTAANISSLKDGVAKVRDDASDLYGEISGGTMPPGDAGKRPDVAWKLANGTSANLPGIGSDVGKATVRNWLACGAPVVSGVTGAPADAAQISSSTLVPGLDTGPVGSTFKDVYAAVLAPCAQACHKAGGAYPGLDLSTQAIAGAALVGKSPGAGACSGKGQFVTAGNCETSLLYNKLSSATPLCGAQMPLGGTPLSKSALDSLCTWIKAGAKTE